MRFPELGVWSYNTGPVAPEPRVSLAGPSTGQPLWLFSPSLSWEPLGRPREGEQGYSYPPPTPNMSLWPACGHHIAYRESSRIQKPLTCLWAVWGPDPAPGLDSFFFLRIPGRCGVGLSTIPASWLELRENHDREGRKPSGI